MKKFDRDAADSAGEALEQALLKAAHSLERELARIVKTGEDDLDRLARRIAETLARLALDGALGGGGEPAASQRTDDITGGSINGIAQALARAARRGARFT